jgi:hypothetical protein
MKFSDQLKTERKRIGLIQAEADAILSSRGKIAAWESGRNIPHVLTQEGALARLRAIPTNSTAKQ